MTAKGSKILKTKEEFEEIGPMVLHNMDKGSGMYCNLDRIQALAIQRQLELH